MLRMASTEGEELKAERRREAERRQRTNEFAMAHSDSPAASQGEVKVQIGAGHDLDEMNVIEALPGEAFRGAAAVGGSCLPAGSDNFAQPPARQRLMHFQPHTWLLVHLISQNCTAPHAAEDKRISISISGVSAHVPLLLQRRSLLSRLNPLELRRRVSQTGSSAGKPTHRQVRDVAGGGRGSDQAAGLCQKRGRRVPSALLRCRSSSM